MIYIYWARQRRTIGFGLELALGSASNLAYLFDRLNAKAESSRLTSLRPLASAAHLVPRRLREKASGNKIVVFAQGKAMNEKLASDAPADLVSTFLGQFDDFVQCEASY